jgi:phosphoglycolate phosphatase (TIGR01487 family)
MRKMRMIATDIDFTLTDADFRLDTRAVVKIRTLEAKGVKVILVSGRNVATTGSLAQFIGTCGFVAAENGGVIAKYVTPIMILGRISNARAAFRMLKKRMGRKVVERADSRYGMRLSDVSLERSFEPGEAREVLRKIGMKVQLVDTGVSFQLLDADVDKGYALARLARLANVSLSRVAAIGDNYNDLSLFRKAEYRIAVANAPDEVKEQADYVCRLPYGRGFLEAVAHIRL